VARPPPPALRKKRKIYKNFISLHLGFWGWIGPLVRADRFSSRGIRYGRHLSVDARRSLWSYSCSGVGLRASGKDVMTLIYCLAGVLALFLFGYLLYALLRAEQF
jgi:K+-transporting ATPase KdpF subunit